MDAISQIDKEVFEWNNKCRTDPKCLIPHLQEMITQFDGEIRKIPGGVNLRTKEGTAVVEELIAYLNTAAPMKELKWHEGVAKAAADHTKD